MTQIFAENEISDLAITDGVSIRIRAHLLLLITSGEEGNTNFQQENTPMPNSILAGCYASDSVLRDRMSSSIDSDC